MLFWNPRLSLAVSSAFGGGEAGYAGNFEVGVGGGGAALPEYGGRFSRRDHTQAQLCALLVLRQFLRADYRGVVALVSEWPELRRALGVAKVPHCSTLAHASRRILADA